MSAASFLPRVLTLDTLREAARGCTGCPLHQTATQTVFGEGLAVLRAPDDAARREAYAGFIRDLRVVAASLT